MSFGYLYLVLYVIQLTKAEALAHHFILIGIAYNQGASLLNMSAQKTGEKRLI